MKPFTLFFCKTKMLRYRSYMMVVLRIIIQWTFRTIFNLFFKLNLPTHSFASFFLKYGHSRSGFSPAVYHPNRHFLYGLSGFSQYTACSCSLFPYAHSWSNISGLLKNIFNRFIISPPTDIFATDTVTTAPFFCALICCGSTCLLSSHKHSPILK